MSGGVGTWRYMAPEMARHEAYDEKVDIYAFSMILYFIFSGRQPLGLWCGWVLSFSCAEFADVTSSKAILLLWERPRCGVASIPKRPQLQTFVGLFAWITVVSHPQNHQKTIRNAKVKSRDPLWTCSSEYRNFVTCSHGHGMPMPVRGPQRRSAFSTSRSWNHQA